MIYSRTHMQFDHQKVTGFSGNEIFCLNRMGYLPGQLCIGNSVLSLGIVRSIGAGISTLIGGEVSAVTKLVYNGRKKSFDKLINESKEAGGLGVSGVTFDVIYYGSYIEFLAVGSAVKSGTGTLAISDLKTFSTSANVQELYCQTDAEFKPLSFVFGNVAYSVGVVGGISGVFKSLRRGEISEFTEMFQHTRHLALNRIKGEAKKVGANAVVGIQVTVSPLMGTQEMMMTGTASDHPLLKSSYQDPVTSDLTNEEMWNMIHIGYMPLELVMGVSVYSLGLVSGITSFFQTLVGGEVEGISEILYEARESALVRLHEDAIRCGADEVVGVKTHVYDLGGGVIEFLAIGTAVKKMNGVKTLHSDLPLQAIMQDKETYVKRSGGLTQIISGAQAGTRPQLRLAQFFPVAILLVVLVLFARVFITYKLIK